MSRDLDRRLSALAEAVELAEGRLDPQRVEPARAVVRRAGERLGHGLEATVVALAGPTGAGKSTLFNALAGADLVAASARRPTTARPTAAVWGQTPGPLLDWLDVPLRHAVAPPGSEFDGLVLLDLPDFDSVERAHRLEVDRMVELVDLLVWVTDPQKYADGTLHERYLRPLASHREAMVVVLNQADALAGPALEACVRDLGGLLSADGLDGVPLLAVSARTGEGLEALRKEVGRRVARREAALERLAGDVDAAVAALGVDCERGKGRGKVDRRASAALVAALGEAAGAPAVVRAVESAHRRRGALAAGWPFVRWVRRARPDPLRRLRLADRAAEADADVRTSLPQATPVQRSQADSAIRSLAAGAGDGLPDPWPGTLRSAATRQEPELPGRLDRAVAGTDLKMNRPLWWRLAGLVQLALAAAAVAGLVWLVALAALGYLQLDDVVPTPEVRGFPLPTALLLGGALGGLLLALLARLINGFGARRRARAARRALHARIEAVARESVLDPVEAELAAYAALCEAVKRAG